MAPAGRLSFVGMGLDDESGVTLAGLGEIEKADIVYAEFYTSALAEGSLKRLEERIGKSITLLSRAEVEDGSALLEACKDANVVLLVAGDPMSATTHVDLRLRATRASIHTAVVHGVSVLTAVPGLLGLQHYKFGRTTTLPFPAEGYSPTSPYEVVSDNLGRGLHTLVLLDIDADNDRFMTANEGLVLLLDMGGRVDRKTFTDDSLACVVARAGSPDAVVRAGRARELVPLAFGRPLHTIVVPGKLHFMEAEALELLAGMPPELGP